MPDMMAIVSKAVFEKQAGKAPTVGTKLRMDRYVSANKNLEPLAEGGRLYLVTVRPPDEALWLVAILDQPEHDGEAWVAEASQVPITDISKLRSKIKFESGVGITAKQGALGMSLQTPRALTAADTALLDAAAGVGHADADSDVDGDNGKQLPPPPADVIRSSGVRSGGLVDAILADPDNVDAKRVYADLLVQNNDPRGEFILLEIALDGPLSIRKREQLRERHEVLRKEHEMTWWPYTGLTERVKHGFLRGVEGSLKNIKTAVNAGLFERDPVVDVTISLDAEEVEKLVKEKWLAKIRRLVIRGQIGDEGFAALCESKALASLTSLNVTNNEITGEGIAAIAASFGKLTTLVLTSNPIGDDGLANLRAWKQLANVETLYLSNCELTADGVADFLDGFTFTKLRKLTLSENELDGVSDTIAKNASRLPALEHLELLRTGLEDDGVKAIGKAKLKSLKRLDARQNDLDASLAKKDERVRV